VGKKEIITGISSYKVEPVVGGDT